MHTFEAVESISEDIFDVLFYDTLYTLNNDFPWSAVGLNINSTNTKKRNAILEIYKTKLNEPNGLISLHKVNDIPHSLLAGAINENYYNIMLGILKADENGSKSFWSEGEYISQLNEALSTFLNNNSLLGFSAVVINDSSVHKYDAKAINSYYSTYTEESVGFVGFPEKEVIKYTVTLD